MTCIRRVRVHNTFFVQRFLRGGTDIRPENRLFSNRSDKRYRFISGTYPGQVPVSRNARAQSAVGLNAKSISSFIVSLCGRSSATNTAACSRKTKLFFRIFTGAPTTVACVCRIKRVNNYLYELDWRQNTCTHYKCGRPRPARRQLSSSCRYGP